MTAQQNRPRPQRIAADMRRAAQRLGRLRNEIEALADEADQEAVALDAATTAQIVAHARKLAARLDTSTAHDLDAFKRADR